MKKILALSFFPAFTPPTNGGQSRLFNFYSALSEHHQVTLLTSTHSGVSEDRVVHGANFIERRIPKDQHFLEQWAILEGFGSGGDLSGPVLAAAATFPTLLHQAYLEEYEAAEIIIHDSPFTAAYDLFRGLDTKLRVYNSYNCESELYRQLHPEQRSSPIHALVEEAEVDILRYADVVHYCNELDHQALRALNTETNASFHYVPHGLTLRPAGNNSENGTVLNAGARTTAVFMGSAHPPNIEAARFIVETLAPRLPHIDFQVLGSCLPEGVYEPNVQRFGIVSDLEKDRVLGTATVALNPMSSGSGANVKVLDYLSSGAPVMSTEFGMRGVDAIAGEHFLLSSLESFESSLRQWIAQPEGLQRIGQAGQHLAAAAYTWSSIAADAAARLAARNVEKAAQPAVSRYLVLNDYESFDAIGGGGTRTRGLCAALAKQSPVVFLSFAQADRVRRYNPIAGVTAIAVPKSAAHRDELARTQAMWHVSAGDIIASRHCDKNLLLLAFYEVLRRTAKMIIVEHCYMGPLPMMFSDRFIYSSQNAESVLKHSTLRGHPAQAELSQHLADLERSVVTRAAAIVVVCEADAREFQALSASTGSIIVIPNGAQPAADDGLIEAAMVTVAPEVATRSAVFVGSAHLPNIESARFICNRLAGQCRDVQFHLIGTVCDAIATPGAKYPPNVRLWGALDDVKKSTVMTACSIAINPVMSGGGSNVKMADYLAHGKFVVTTEFGRRGYPASIANEILVADLPDFASGIRSTLDNPETTSTPNEARRKRLFAESFSMEALGSKMHELAHGIDRSTKRVLFVTYRYTDPAQGGAEAMLAELVKALATSGEFQVDVVAPEVSGMRNAYRFTEDYSFGLTGALVNVPNIRHMRFPLDAARTTEGGGGQLEDTWKVQVLFEHALSEQLGPASTESGLSWGWGEWMGSSRRAYASCGLHIAAPGRVVLEGSADASIFLRALNHREEVLASIHSEAGQFHIDFEVDEISEVRLLSSVSLNAWRIDPRPTAFAVRSLRLADSEIDLRRPTLLERALRQSTSAKVFRLLSNAAEATRFALGTRLTDTRGPFSSKLEEYIEENVDRYDLVVTHNNIFRPTVFAVEAAKRRGVPTVLIPHSHFDDDYYHFPDIMGSAQAADIVLASPKVACDFLREKGCNVEYFPAPIDVSEPFSAEDQAQFKRIYASDEPFVVVLGRKAGAKNYSDVIWAVEQFNREHGSLRLVMIGPDDDCEPINSPMVKYMGRQPREVVRGALLSCVALVNMSASESFGIVLLEAWLAGKPVIVNAHCAAFHDMAKEGWNALVVERGGLLSALLKLKQDEGLRNRLAANGRITAAEYDRAVVSEKFLALCRDIAPRPTTVSWRRSEPDCASKMQSDCNVLTIRST